MEIELTKKYLKQKLQLDKTTLYGFENERTQILNLFSRTAREGESNSVLLIGPKKSGKTTVSS
jgi:origin recognition complex subunit 4